MSALVAVRTGLLPDASLLLVRTYADGEVTAERYVDGVGTREVTLTGEAILSGALSQPVTVFGGGQR